MPKRPASAAKKAVAARPSPVLRSVLIGWAAATLGALVVLEVNGVKLGQGSLFYRYSPFQAPRTLRALPLVPIAAVVALAVAWIGRRDGWRGWAGRVGAAAGLVLLVAWAWWAPPVPLAQHTFNMRSPSQEGAFFLETRQSPTVLGYLRQFDTEIQKPPAKMGGTRVISNPPGMTVVAMLQQRWWPPRSVEDPGPIERELIAMDTPAWDMALASNTIRFALVLLAMWGLSLGVMYGVARLYLPPAGALVFAVVAGFNPSSVEFVPGKDPAQLLTIALMMWAWLAGMRRGTAALSFLSGVAMALGLVSGLIHAWVMVALVVATAWHVGVVRTVVRQALPAAAGCAAFMGCMCLAGWNMPATLLTVTRRFAEVQGTFAINRWAWVVIGLPLFLLFVSPGLAAGVALTVRRGSLRGFGTKLMLATAGVMLLTYLTGVTYELPRLWVAFLPALTLGAMIDLPLMRARRGRAVAALVMIVVVQVLATGLHWTRLDVREAEFRLSQKRFFT